MNTTSKPLRTCALIVLLAFFLLILTLQSFAATGHFEVYCDGVGVFLTKVDGAPAPRKLVLFSRQRSTFSGRWLGQGEWSEVLVYRDGCVPDGKCEPIARGRVWIDQWDKPDADSKSPQNISGKYELELNGKHLEGSFTAKQYYSKRPLRICM